MHQARLDHRERQGQLDQQGHRDHKVHQVRLDHRDQQQDRPCRLGRSSSIILVRQSIRVRCVRCAFQHDRARSAIADQGVHCFAKGARLVCKAGEQEGDLHRFPSQTKLLDGTTPNRLQEKNAKKAQMIPKLGQGASTTLFLLHRILISPCPKIEVFYHTAR